MPCDSVRTIKVNLGKLNFERLEQVLKQDGWSVSVYGNKLSAHKGADWFAITQGSETAEHSMTTLRATEVLNRVQRLYSERTVTDAAKKYGFRVQSRKEDANSQTLAIRIGR